MPLLAVRGGTEGERLVAVFKQKLGQFVVAVERIGSDAFDGSGHREGGHAAVCERIRADGGQLASLLHRKPCLCPIEGMVADDNDRRGNHDIVLHAVAIVHFIEGVGGDESQSGSGSKGQVCNNRTAEGALPDLRHGRGDLQCKAAPVTAGVERALPDDGRAAQRHRRDFARLGECIGADRLGAGGQFNGCQLGGIEGIRADRQRIRAVLKRHLGQLRALKGVGTDRRHTGRDYDLLQVVVFAEGALGDSRYGSRHREGKIRLGGGVEQQRHRLAVASLGVQDTLHRCQCRVVRVHLNALDRQTA